MEAEIAICAFLCVAALAVAPAPAAPLPPSIAPTTMAAGRALKLAELDRDVREARNHAAALNNRCWQKAIWNIELKAALADCDEALRLSPGNGLILDSRGLVNMRLKQFKDAVSDFDAALAALPEFVPSLYARGVARDRMGDKRAAADLDGARRLDPKIDGVFEGYGMTPREKAM